MDPRGAGPFHLAAPCSRKPQASTRRSDQRTGKTGMARKPAGSTGNGVGKVLEMLTEHSVEYVDLRFTDPRGKWQHTAQHVSTIDEDVFRDGIMFDGSSIAGWKAINEFDMILMLDPDTAVMDPFCAKPRLIDHLRHRRAVHRPALSSRPAQHREEGRGVPEVHRHRRYRVLRPGGRVLRVRQREVRHRRQLRHLPDRQPGRPAGRPEGLSGRQHGPPPRGQGRLFPGAAGR